ncbi:hypothetical protein, partial [Colwellia marinimaniae]|uniref:hypothetical protein n=1 Tax=Colwellia marinimaniae TaxID=1513592 RepID=UPI001F231F95
NKYSAYLSIRRIITRLGYIAAHDHQELGYKYHLLAQALVQANLPSSPNKCVSCAMRWFMIISTSITKLLNIYSKQKNISRDWYYITRTT